MQIILNNLEAKYIQIFKQISLQINQGLLKDNEKLPSKRDLAIELNVSLNTIINAYNLLLDEGYIYSIEKKGYFVSTQPMVHSSSDIQIYAEKKQVDYSYDFTTQGIEQFNSSSWKKITKDVLDSTAFINKTPLEGDLGLRNAIAKHLNQNRGIQASASQIIIGSGLEMLGLILPLLQIPTIMLENPGYHKLNTIAKLNNLDVQYIELDEEGCQIPSYRAILYTTPFNQFPTGIKMSISRKKELAQWAIKTNSYIIEDDFDAEFRINASPTSSIYSLCRERVIFFSTFSTTMFPGLRISYAILPDSLLNSYTYTYSTYSCSASSLTQIVLKEFISQGAYASHVNRLKRNYLRKRQICMNELKKTSLISFHEKKNYLSLWIEIPESIDSTLFSHKLIQKRIKLQAMSSLDVDHKKSNIYILGYTSIPKEDIPKGIQAIIKIIEEMC